MELKKIFENIEILQSKGDLNKEIHSISSDSREIQKGDLFFAIPGFDIDGTKFIPKAIENGAVAIVIDETHNIEEQLAKINSEQINSNANITFIQVANIRHVLAIASCNLYDNPSTKLKLIGVTGTKGKTSSTFMIKSILQAHGYKTGLIGGIAVYINDKQIDISKRTTDESYKIQKELARMVDNNVDIVILEVSSQAMKLNRVDGCHFDATLFTNLSEDHISPKEHKDMEDYFNAKLSLQKMSPFVVYNLDNSYTARLPKLLNKLTYGKNLISFGIRGNEFLPHIYATDLQFSNKGVEYNLHFNDINNFDLEHFDSDQSLKLQKSNDINNFDPKQDLESQKAGKIYVSIPGESMAYNSLGAIGIALHFGVTIQDIQEGLAKVKVLGRSEIVPNPLGLHIMIDYAHTADSLRSILETVKPYVKGRLICCWGVGGNRDSKKRPIMGEISGNLADLTVLTSDQVRAEDPNKILDDIEVGLKKSGGKYIRILNRTEAIRYSISIMNKDDMLVLPGIGNDMYIEYMHVKYPYNERVVIRKACEDLIEKRGKSKI